VRYRLRGIRIFQTLFDPARSLDGFGGERRGGDRGEEEEDLGGGDGVVWYELFG